MLPTIRFFSQRHEGTKSFNHLGWKRHLKSSSSYVILPLPSSSLNCVPTPHTSTSFAYLQVWWLHPFLLGSLFQCLITLPAKKFFLMSNLKLPWHNLRTVSFVLSLATSCFLSLGTNLTTIPFQAVVESDNVLPVPPFLQVKQPQLPQPLFIGLLLQTLSPCAPLSFSRHAPASQWLSWSEDPASDTGPEAPPQQCPLQGDNHWPPLALRLGWQACSSVDPSSGPFCRWASHFTSVNWDLPSQGTADKLFKMDWWVLPPAPSVQQISVSKWCSKSLTISTWNIGSSLCSLSSSSGG